MVEAGKKGGGARRGVLAAIAAIVLLALGAFGIAWSLADRAERAMQTQRRLVELERRVDAHVKSVQGRVSAPDPAPTEFVVLLRRAPGATTTRLFHRGEDFGEFPGPGGDRLATAAKEWVGRISAAPAAAEARGRVESEPTVPSVEVIGVVDALIVAGMKDITFVGTPPPGSTLDGALPSGK